MMPEAQNDNRHKMDDKTVTTVAKKYFLKTWL